MNLEAAITAAVFGSLRDDAAASLLRVGAGTLEALDVAFRESWRGVTAVGTEVMRPDPQMLTLAPRGRITRGDLIHREHDFYLVTEVPDVERPVLTVVRMYDTVMLSGVATAAGVSADLGWVLVEGGLVEGTPVEYRNKAYLVGPVQTTVAASSAPLAPA